MKLGPSRRMKIELLVAYNSQGRKWNSRGNCSWLQSAVNLWKSMNKFGEPLVGATGFKCY